LSCHEKIIKEKMCNYITHREIMGKGKEKKKKSGNIEREKVGAIIASNLQVVRI